MAAKVFKTRPYQSRIVQKVVDLWTGRYVRPESELEFVKLDALAKFGNDDPVRSVKSVKFPQFANSEGHRVMSIMLESPTGSGKSVMGLKAVKDLQELLARETGDDLCVAWVAMSQVLLKQVVREHESFGLGIRDLIPVSMFATEANENLNAVLAAKAAGRPVALVVDECQHDATASMTHIHSVVQPDFTLGLSATPYRTDKVRLVFDSVVKDSNIQSLVSDGYLSEYHHFTIDDWTPATVASIYLADRERWGKTAVYFKNIALCDEFAGLLRAAGVGVEVVTGDSDCDSQLEDFENGVFDVLVSCMKLTEGFDCASLRTVFVRDSQRGPTTQIAGRVFRTHESCAFKHVVQSKHSKWPVPRTVMPTASFMRVGGEWRGLQANKNIDELIEITRADINANYRPLPRFLQAVKLKAKK